MASDRQNGCAAYVREAAALLLLAVESLGLGDSVVGGGDGAGEGVALVVVLGALSHLGRDGEPHAVLAKVLRFLRVVAERGSDWPRPKSKARTGQGRAAGQTSANGEQWVWQVQYVVLQ